MVSYKRKRVRLKIIQPTLKERRKLSFTIYTTFYKKNVVKKMRLKWPESEDNLNKVQGSISKIKCLS